MVEIRQRIFRWNVWRPSNMLAMEPCVHNEAILVQRHTEQNMEIWLARILNVGNLQLIRENNFIVHVAAILSTNASLVDILLHDWTNKIESKSTCASPKIPHISFTKEPDCNRFSGQRLPFYHYGTRQQHNELWLCVIAKLSVQKHRRHFEDVILIS